MCGCNSNKTAPLNFSKLNKKSSTPANSEVKRNPRKLTSEEKKMIITRMLSR